MSTGGTDRDLVSLPSMVHLGAFIA